MPRSKKTASRAKPGENKLKLRSQLSFALYASTNRVSRLYRSYLEPLGLTFPQYLVLLVLWEQAPCAVTNLAHALDLESNTITPIVKRMEGLGYVTRSRDPLDERRVLVGLTEQGQAFRRQAILMRERMVAQIGLEERTLDELRDSLWDLSGVIDARSA
ncbi:MarR family winged helix-turn-helix transcriptional regulator [Lichenifustis flavocetrariae]|uniref:MarR family transcriptional regulator n=1 Tax=Lichenifustis flavocetrariae TaxID=2949735 RepID=A0AA41YTT8_9HYPH|nr:MarR family transcriptional regulator [Lichenifustis flavocetrariae]MCW6507200.1 MarR family transcriptional regulator [Lichenifustis flavocetrariae]